MRTIEQALAPYKVQGPAFALRDRHWHCYDADAVENGLLAVEMAIASYGIRLTSRVEIEDTVREEFSAGVQEWQNAS